MDKPQGKYVPPNRRVSNAPTTNQGKKPASVENPAPAATKKAPAVSNSPPTTVEVESLADRLKRVLAIDTSDSSSGSALPVEPVQEYPHVVEIVSVPGVALRTLDDIVADIVLAEKKALYADSIGPVKLAELFRLVSTGSGRYLLVLADDALASGFVTKFPAATGSACRSHAFSSHTLTYIKQQPSCTEKPRSRRTTAVVANRMIRAHLGVRAPKSGREVAEEKRLSEMRDAKRNLHQSASPAATASSTSASNGG